MSDREKVINGLMCCQYSSKSHCDGCPYCYEGLCETNDCTADLASDAIALLEEQDKRYAMMVVDWLRDMAHNNYLDSSHMTLWDAILDIRERAQTGLENYFRDYDSDTKQRKGR